MRLSISHRTSYHYDEPPAAALQELRLAPRRGASQDVLSWDVAVDGGKVEVEFSDHHANPVQLISLTPGPNTVLIRCEGEVDTIDTGGVITHHAGFAPLWLYLRQTTLTKPGAGLVALLADFDAATTDDPVARMHELSSHVAARITYDAGWTHAASTAEESIAAGHGVCQDHAHVFMAAARQLDVPARYVSGYLFTPGNEADGAMHAWAEVWIDDLGWVCFDVSNGICPDEHYVRVAVGLDYWEAAPIRGVRFGDANEEMDVSLQVQQ